MAHTELMTYSQALEGLPQTKHLLLGNGFSIVFDDVFKYTNLFEFAKENGLNERIQGVFDYLGTNNFEGVLRLLDDMGWMVKHYDLVTREDETPSVIEDLKEVKEALVEAVTKAHLPKPNKISDDRETRCVEFLASYRNIFTTNYDLLLYGVSMHGLNQFASSDCFRAPTNNREAALQVVANVVMPNLTRLKYRKLYELYPGKMCMDESRDEYNMCIKGRILNIGRTIGTGEDKRKNTELRIQNKKRKIPILGTEY